MVHTCQFLYLINTPSNLWRTTNEEKRAIERQMNDQYVEVRKAAEVHRQESIKL
jgi:hypothetical protein